MQQLAKDCLSRSVQLLASAPQQRAARRVTELTPWAATTLGLLLRPQEATEGRQGHDRVRQTSFAPTHHAVARCDFSEGGRAELDRVSTGRTLEGDLIVGPVSP